MKRYYITLSIAAVLVFLDQAAKMLIMDSLALWRSKPVIDGFFNLVHVQNRGAAFGFLNRSDIEWQFGLFAAFTVLAVGLVLFMVKGLKPATLPALSAFGAILGGALGNFIDRVRFRHVVDFLDFYLGEMHWPAFNVADIAICYGVTVFALVTFFPKKSEKTKQS
jgi:signal peptidase II